MLDNVVVGGGVAGLSLAFRLLRAGQSVRVLEASARPGGLMHTLRPHGWVIEQGPQSLQTSPALCRLVEDLDLVSEVIVPDPDASRRYLVGHDGLIPLPHSLASAMRSSLWRKRDVLRAALEPLVPKGPAEPQSVAQVMRRRLGPGLTDAVLDAFVAGVFGGDPEALDMRGAFPDPWAWEQEFGSLVRGARAVLPGRREEIPGWAPKAFFALHGGNARLVQRLAEVLGEALWCDAPATGLERDGVGWVVNNPVEPVRARRVWLATPLATSATLVPELAPRLKMPSAPIAAVTLVYAKEDVPELRGFGWLAPQAVRRDVLGCLWVSSTFPGHVPGHAALRVMIGGVRSPELLDLSSPALVRHAKKVLTEVQGIQATPVYSNVAAYPVGIPQYPVGWADHVDALQLALPGVRFVGWGTTGVGLSATAATTERLAES